MTSTDGKGQNDFIVSGEGVGKEIGKRGRVTRCDTSCQKDTIWGRDELVIEMIPSALLISKSDETTHHQPVVAHICGDFLDQADRGIFPRLSAGSSSLSKRSDSSD